MIYWFTKGWGFEWIVLPLFFTCTVHFAVWCAASFLAWDVFWLSTLAHRTLFLATGILIWGALISDEIYR